MGGAPAQTRSERVLKQPNEPRLSEGGYTSGSDDGRLKLEELIAMCIKLSKQVLDLEKEKDAQAEFASIWYRSRGPHRNSALPLDVQSTAAPQRISGRTS
ncbi:hypothetical protein Tco_1326088 [Tanacetum coccineum]